MPLVDHPEGNYRFLPGIAPYSAGVVAAPGFGIVHATLQVPLPYRDGFALVERHLAAVNRPRAALCAIELRSPQPFSFEGFSAFNAQYAGVLSSWGLFVNGINPIARTNVAPALNPPPEPVLYGFSYTRPAPVPDHLTFVVAGAGELPEGVLAPEAIVWGAETSAEAISHKAEFVLDLMENRLRGLQANWSLVTAVDVYTIHPIHHLMPGLLERLGPAAAHGIHWSFSRPPITGIEFEMDVRGVEHEIRIG